MTALFADSIPGTNPTVSFCSSWFCSFSYQSLLSSLLAIIVTVGLMFFIRAKLTSGKPGKLQMVVEWFLDYVTNLVKTYVHEDAKFVVPLAATLGMYILISNWLDIFPLTGAVHPAASDFNQTLAMALLVIVMVQWYSIKVLGLKWYLLKFTRPFNLPWPVRVLFTPLNILEELVKPVTLSLRLFGNIFAGLIMIYLLTTEVPTLLNGLNGLLGSTGGGFVSGAVSVFFVIVWKFFDVFFVGSIQAFIFMLLTVLYFGMAREGLHEREARAHVSQPQRSTTINIGEGA